MITLFIWFGFKDKQQQQQQHQPQINEQMETFGPKSTEDGD